MKCSALMMAIATLAFLPTTVSAKEPLPEKDSSEKKKRRPSYPGDDYIHIYEKLLKLGDAQKATLDATVDKYAQRLSVAQKAATTKEGKSAYNSLGKEFMEAVKADFTKEQRAILTADREARKQWHSGKRKQEPPAKVE